MLKTFLPRAAIAVALVASIACESSKSANPLSPTVAGPIPGVNITPPKLLEPASGWKYKTNQPITLLLENASSNGQRPLSYLFQIASDSGFGTVIFEREGITPGEGGRTSLRLPDALASGRTYYWRARAQDGANTGPFSSPVAFEVLQPIVIEAPVPLSPINGATAASNPPPLRFRNASRSGPVGAIRYSVEVSLNEAFTAIVYSEQDGERPNETQMTPHAPLAASTTFYWRVRASDPENQGPWSQTASFATPAAAPPPSGGGGGGGGGGGSASCAFNDGEKVIECIAAKYPERLRPVGSLGQRNANMEFIRDRIIESGICGGMDLAWNLKRGVGPRSIDAIAWRRGGRLDVVDIGRAYDDINRTLELTWALVGGTPGWDPFPRPNCQ